MVLVTPGWGIILAAEAGSGLHEASAVGYKPRGASRADPEGLEWLQDGDAAAEPATRGRGKMLVQ